MIVRERLSLCFLVGMLFAVAVFLAPAAAQDVPFNEGNKKDNGELAGIKDIASGKESGVKKVLTDRSKKVSKLLKIIKPSAYTTASNKGRLLSIKVLGEMRAKETVDLLLKMFVREIREENVYGRPSVFYPSKVHQAVEDALVSIGLPCRKPVLQQFAALGMETLETKILTADADLAYGKSYPVSEKRKVLVRLFEKIEGTECVEFLINLEMKREKDKEKIANLKAALGFLDTEEQKQEIRKKTPPSEEASKEPKGLAEPAEKTTNWLLPLLIAVIVVETGFVLFLLLRRKK